MQWRLSVKNAAAIGLKQKEIKSLIGQIKTQEKLIQQAQQAMNTSA